MRDLRIACNDATDLLIELAREFGDAPETAIAKIRAARPGSIETTAQEEYVRNCQFVRSGPLD